jgi:GR25 family glycosyltransferase involved in LPS biosynthesis
MPSNQTFLSSLALVFALFLLLHFLRGEPTTPHDVEQEKKQTSTNERNSAYVVKAIVVPARLDQARQSLESFFPIIDFIEGFNQDDVDLKLMESMTTFDNTWDFGDGRIREAYSQDYAREGEVACTLAHRRALESFLHQDPKTEIALLLEDDSTPLSPAILDEIDELLAVAPQEWDFIQLGRCWDLWCEKDEVMDSVAEFGAKEPGSTPIALYESRGFELCSHAYLVTRRGAEKILQYSLPVMLPFVSGRGF